VTSLRRLFILVIIIVFIAFFIAVPSPRVFHNWRRKRRVGYGTGGLKTHGSAHPALPLLKSGKSLSHLLMRLTDESIVGAAHGN
jgi:hypothetical protein